MPTATGRVTIEPVVKGRWGLPVARFEGNSHPDTFDIADMQASRAEAWLKEAGAISTSQMTYKTESVSAGQHQAGTCRMGDDPKGSVVNRHCQVNGGFNPVLTIMALAYYASSALVSNWKGTAFRS